MIQNLLSAGLGESRHFVQKYRQLKSGWVQEQPPLSKRDDSMVLRFDSFAPFVARRSMLHHSLSFSVVMCTSPTKDSNHVTHMAGTGAFLASQCCFNESTKAWIALESPLCNSSLLVWLLYQRDCVFLSIASWADGLLILYQSTQNWTMLTG